MNMKDIRNRIRLQVIAELDRLREIGFSDKEIEEDVKNRVIFLSGDELLIIEKYEDEDVV